MDGLIAAAEPDPQGGVVLQDRFVNHQFDRVYSGLYYQIKPVTPGPGGQISRSLFDQTLDRPRTTTARRASPRAMPRGRRTSICACCRGGWNFPSAATPEPNDTRAYIFMVAGDLAEVDAESARLQRHPDLVLRCFWVWA